MECKVGTPGYQAPEMANGAKVTTAIDIWSYGILLHEWAVGYKPANSISDVIIIEKHWNKVDPQLLELVKLCLKYVPEQRNTAREALKHPYFD